MNNVWNVGYWRVNLREGWICNRSALPRRKIRPDARLMAVLRILIENAGQTVSAETVLSGAWPNRVVGRDSVTTAIYQLRQLLGDCADNPQFIASDHRRGYRLIAELSVVEWPRSRRMLGGIAATLAAATVSAWAIGQTAQPPSFVYVEPIQNYAESPLQEPLFSAVESVFLSELVRNVPGRVRTKDAEDAAFRLQATMVACDLGPTLVMQLLDTRNETYIWSQAYNLDEVAASGPRPTLAEIVATDVAAAIP